jgi:hypothetical protein
LNEAASSRIGLWVFELNAAVTTLGTNGVMHARSVAGEGAGWQLYWGMHDQLASGRWCGCYDALRWAYGDRVFSPAAFAVWMKWIGG